MKGKKSFELSELFNSPLSIETSPLLPDFFLDKMVREVLQIPDPVSIPNPISVPKNLNKDTSVFAPVVPEEVVLEFENLSVIKEPTIAEVLQFA